MSDKRYLVKIKSGDNAGRELIAYDYDKNDGRYKVGFGQSELWFFGEDLELVKELPGETIELPKKIEPIDDLYLGKDKKINVSLDIITDKIDEIIKKQNILLDFVENSLDKEL